MQFILICEVLLHSSQKAKLEVHPEGYPLIQKAFFLIAPTFLSKYFCFFLFALHALKRIYNIKSEKPNLKPL